MNARRRWLVALQPQCRLASSADGSDAYCNRSSTASPDRWRYQKLRCAFAERDKNIRHAAQELWLTTRKFFSEQSRPSGAPIPQFVALPESFNPWYFENVLYLF
jgi:hypothetical protein